MVVAIANGAVTPPVWAVAHHQGLHGTARPGRAGSIASIWFVLVGIDQVTLGTIRVRAGARDGAWTAGAALGH